ncbi:trimethylamine methyltransferase family protein [Pelagibius sp. Alg239-R121]|uniref:trimethylamine methyltransferase family protein n=1 Tax=Pelagibius sp. Alg239-R121 TaxID=2993448 RepID=UPI0024A7272D|nr:trimethylamine methyltransferase family protein [Pelagibius sp. Alg239-R121]
MSDVGVGVSSETAAKEATERSGRRSGRSGARRSKRAGQQAGFTQPPWKPIVNSYAPTELLNNEQIERIHDASLTILEEVGMDFLLEEARDLLAKAGAEVTPGSERVRFDRDMILEAVATAPSEFTLHARNPAHNLPMGGRNFITSMVASAPNCSDSDNGRRVGNQVDFRNFIRLGQKLNIIHMFGGYPVEPVDLPPATRHLDCLSDFITLGDKVFHAYSLGRERNLDALEMVRIARGLTEDQLDQEPSLLTIINTSSPLRLDVPMLRGIIEMARRNQVVVVTPFTLSGAMAPVTLAGALAQQNAEALAGLAFAQIVRPGAPVMYGGFTSNVDMKSGAPAFGTPEYIKTAQIGGQLARRYGIPYRSSNVNASNIVDAQAAYESVFALWGAVTGHTNLLKHGAGWLEGGLCASFEKVIIDADLLQMVAAYLEPLEIDDASLGLDAVRDVGPGGHFFGTEHTQERYENAFYAPIVSDWRNFESWEEAGSETATQRANRIYKQLIQEYEAPPLDQAIADELSAFVAKRKEEGGVPTDF